MIALRLRRVVVIAAIFGSLVLGVATVRAAALWTAAGAPLAVAPVSVQELTTRLADEQARSADLRRRLDELTAAGADLATALDAARARITTDAATAADLTSRLAQAKTRLRTLERSIARAKASLATSRAPATPPPVTGGEGSADEHEPD